MPECINRLVKCGYTREKAEQLCFDFVRNLSLFDLKCFVVFMESVHHVDKV